MISFDPYPIKINGSKKDEAVRAPVLARFNKGEITEDQKKQELSRLDPNKWDYVADRSPEAFHYEGRVKALLSYIRSNMLGRCLLDTLRTGGTLPIWIIPYDSQDVDADGDGNATVKTVPYHHVNGRAIRLAYSFDMFAYTTKWGQAPGSRADEVLLHEMVHAYRFAHPSVRPRLYPALPGYPDPEEFLAHQMTNVYRSLWGAKKFVLDYSKRLLAPATTCEAALRSSKPLMDSLALFLADDPLTKHIAKLKTLYNPFADFERIKRGGAIGPHCNNCA